MLSHLGKKDWLGKKNYIFELKLDGFRIILYKDKDKIELLNKKGTDKTQEYPELQKLAKFIKPKSCVLDGEVIIYDENGMPSFNLMQKRNLRTKFSISQPVTYVAFDILEIDGKKLVDLPLFERKKILHDSIIEDKLIELPVETENGKALWKEVVKRRLEGVIAKKKDSLYHIGTRSWDWVKIKNLNTADVVIVGYTSDKRSVSSLAMALYRNGKLEYIGKVGTGFNEQMLYRLKEMFLKLESRKIPVANDPKDKDIRWLKPELVAEVEYLHVTHDNLFRAPAFKGLRDDKPVKECTWEEQIKEK